MSELAATPTLVLVANAGDGSISTFRQVDGALERLTVTPDLPGCSTFAVDGERNLVFAGVKGHDGGPAAVVTLTLDRATGTLTPTSRLDLPDGGLNYVALTREGSVLLGASYGGNYGFSASVAGGGVVSDPITRVSFTHLHSVLPSHDGNFAYFVSLGDDLIAQYAIAEDASLHALSPATVAAPTDSGPRHLAVSAAGDAVYVLTEFTAEVLHFARDRETGALELVAATPAFDPSTGLAPSKLGLDPKTHHVIWGADLQFGADESHLWASERAESTLASLAVAADGTLSAPTGFTTTEPQPRGIALSADGAYLIATGERSTTVSVYAVHGGELELLQQIETGAGANWVRFV